MINSILKYFSAVIAVAVTCYSFSSFADATKRRLGDLRKNDLVVTDVGTSVDTNSVLQVVTNYDATVVVPREVRLVADASSTKQDMLPYPTNAIPASAISGLPSLSFTNDLRRKDERLNWGDVTNAPDFLTEHQSLSFTNDLRRKDERLNWGDVTNAPSFIDSSKTNGCDSVWATNVVYNATNGLASVAYVDSVGASVASNSVYTSNILATAAIGVHPAGTVLELAGKNIQEAMQYLVNKRVIPGKPTYPSISIAPAASADINVEVGKPYSMAYTISTSAGSYTYGPSTGVTFDEYYVWDTADNTSGERSGTFPSFYVKDDTSYKVQAKAHYTDGAQPHDNQGGVVTNDDLRIWAAWYDRKSSRDLATSVSSGTVKGYRNWYYYLGTDLSDIDSSFIRQKATSLGSAKSAATKNGVAAAKGTKRVMIALPAYNSTFGYKKELTSVIDVGGMGLDIFSRFTVVSVPVDAYSANAPAMSYNVWVFENADGIDATTFNFVLSDVASSLSSSKPVVAAASASGSADYTPSVGLNVALTRLFDGPIDVSGVFHSTNDLLYYVTKKAFTAGVSEYWLGKTPYPYSGQIVSLSVPGCIPTNYVLQANSAGVFDTVRILTTNDVNGILSATVSSNDVAGLITKYDETNLTDRISAKVSTCDFIDATNGIWSVKAGTNDFIYATNLIAGVTVRTSDWNKVSLKQDALPYGTNAVPWEVITNAPVFIDSGSTNLCESLWATNFARIVTNDLSQAIRTVAYNVSVNSNRVNRMQFTNAIDHVILGNTTTAVATIQAQVSNMNVRIPSRAPLTIYDTIDGRCPAVRIDVDGGTGYSVFCTDGTYHDLRDTLKDYGDDTPVMSFSFTNLYGRTFTTNYLYSMFGHNVRWVSDLVPTAFNIWQPITSVCGGSDYPPCYGRTATVRELLCEIMTRDYSVWNDTSKAEGHSYDFVDFAGLRYSVLGAMAYARNAHATVAQLRYDYDYGICSGLVLPEVSSNVTSNFSYVYLTPGDIARIDVTNSVSAFNITFAIPEFLGDTHRSGSCSALVYCRGDVKCYIRGSAYDSYIGVDPVQFTTGYNLLTIYRVAYDRGTKESYYFARVDQMAYPVVNPNFTVSNSTLVDTVESLMAKDNPEFYTAVASVVTNDVDAGLTEWLIGQVYTNSYGPTGSAVDYCMTNTGMRWSGSVWEMHVAGMRLLSAGEVTNVDSWVITACDVGDGATYTTTNTFISSIAAAPLKSAFDADVSSALVSRRVRNPSVNALGLAYSRDIPRVITNNVAPWAMRGNDEPVTDLSSRTTFGQATNIADAVSVARIRAAMPVRLGSYLWETDNAFEDFDAATNRLAYAYPSYRGGCSGVCGSRYHGRNLDWTYDDLATIVVRVPAAEGRFASIGLCDGVIPDAFLAGGTWTNAYLTVPFTMNDGMNDHGVVIQQNVVQRDTAKSAAWHTRKPTSVICFMIVRYSLDRCSTAYDAAVMIRDRNFVPSEYKYDFHYLVSDRNGSYIVEDGVIIDSSSGKRTDVMTNFRIGGTVGFSADGKVNWASVASYDPYGEGLERYDLVRSSGCSLDAISGVTNIMRQLWYTRSYVSSTSPFWLTEYCDPDNTSLSISNAMINPSVFDGVRASMAADYVDDHDKTSANYRSGRTWQTVHTSVYDKEALTLRLYTQEDESSLREFYLIKDAEREFSTDGLATTNYVDSSVRPVSNAVVRLSENTNVTFKVDGSDFVVKTNGVEVWRSSNKAVSQAYSVSAATTAANTAMAYTDAVVGHGVKRYALFTIPLNPGATNHKFFDIELKATTNNYIHVGSGDSSMMFYCASNLNGAPGMTEDIEWDHDWCRLYILSSKVSSDVRQWIRIRNTGDLGDYQPRDLVVLVDPSSDYFRRGQGSEWCREDNDMLTWSYVRITASGPEMDEGGTKQLWRPIMPVRWYSSLPGWADQTPWTSQ